MIKLKNIRKMGRFKNPETGNPVNVHKGSKKGYGTTVYFWLYRGKRNFISEKDWFDQWRKNIVGEV